MTDSDKIMHPQHFGADPADIRIRISPAIRIGIPGDFWLTFWCWRRFALSGCSCSFTMCAFVAVVEHCILTAAILQPRASVSVLCYNR